MPYPNNRLSEFFTETFPPGKFANELLKLQQPGEIAGGATNYMKRLEQMPLEQRLSNASVLPVPIASDLAGLGADAMMYQGDPESRTTGNALLSALGLLPFFPGMTAYHGSPHKFDKFDSTKIGTGEGAQAYGHGLYFAENPDVAKQYREALGGKEWLVDGKLVGRYGDMKDFPDKALASAAARIAALKKGGGVISKADAAAAESGFRGLISGNPGMRSAPEIDAEVKAMRSLVGKKLEERLGGATYNVDIPEEHIDKMLDWDAPLSERHVALIDKAKKLDPMLEYQLHTGISGEGLYSSLRDSIGSDKASEWLKQNGIPGIKYYDGASRGKGKGTRNFVVFDDQIVNVLKRE